MVEWSLLKLDMSQHRADSRQICVNITGLFMRNMIRHITTRFTDTECLMQRVWCRHYKCWMKQWKPNQLKGNVVNLPAS